MAKEIALDFDDVICGFAAGLRKSILIEFGVEVPPFGAWDLDEVLNPIVGRHWWREWMREQPDRWAKFPPVPGAIGGIKQLRDDGHYIEVVTAKPEWAEHVIWDWFGKHRPAVNRVTIVGMDVPKSEATDAELLVDDKIDNVEEFMADGRDAILFNQSTNDGVFVQAPRVNNWRELVELIRMEEAVKL